MKTSIYYFSGTGNSLAVARDLGQLINGSEVIPIVSAANMQSYSIDADSIGIVFPVYCQDAPVMVKEFVNNLKFNKDTYIFAISTSNGVPGNTMFNVNKLLEKRGLSLGSGFNVDMPGNYIAFADYSNSADVRAARLNQTKKTISEIAEIVKKRNVKYDYSYRLLRHLKGSLNKFVLNKIYHGERKFYTDSRCTRCGTCVKVCPRDNIKMADDGITWGESCYQCLACIHWCPAASIQNGNKTKNRLRYHHPDVRVNDIIAQKNS